MYPLAAWSQGPCGFPSHSRKHTHQSVEPSSSFKAKLSRHLSVCAYLPLSNMMMMSLCTGLGKIPNTVDRSWFAPS
jgi:hypothetical protein